MKKNFCFLIIFIISVVFVPSASAQGGVQTITLKDGTVIKGKLIDVTDTTYTILTQHMGQIQIDAENLVSINAAQTQGASSPFQASLNNAFTGGMGNPQGGPFQAGGPAMGQLQMLQQTMMADPEIMQAMQEIMNDPELVNILTDQNFLMEMSTMDPSKIQSNQRLQELMNNPKFQKILNSIGQKVGVPNLAP